MRDLRHAADAARLIWEANMGNMCLKCSTSRVQSVSETIGKLQTGIQKQRDLLDVSQKEAFFLDSGYIRERCAKCE